MNLCKEKIMRKLYSNICDLLLHVELFSILTTDYSFIMQEIFYYTFCFLAPPPSLSLVSVNILYI